MPASQQERKIEYFLQYSFGARFLFEPDEFKKGNATREPCDLAFVTPDLAVLFYMTESDAKERRGGNEAQAKGYLRLWATGDDRFKLAGKNRFGDALSFSFDPQRVVVQVLVAPGECGVVLHPRSRGDLALATVTIPEELLLRVASFNGTVVDLLRVLGRCLETGGQECESEFNNVLSLIHRYVEDSGILLPVDGQLGAAFWRFDELLRILRRPSELGAQPQVPAHMFDIVARAFSDFSAADCQRLIRAMTEIIDDSRVTKFKDPIIRRVDGLYYPFVLWTVDIRNENNQITFEQVHEASKNAKGEIESFSLDMTMASHLIDVLPLSLPHVLPISQGSSLARELAARGLPALDQP